jgi:hypothetical protein
MNIANGIILKRRAISSVGRAHPLQGWGRKFEPCIAHQILIIKFLASVE